MPDRGERVGPRKKKPSLNEETGREGTGSRWNLVHLGRLDAHDRASGLMIDDVQQLTLDRDRVRRPGMTARVHTR
jgi:hypothetical protein